MSADVGNLKRLEMVRCSHHGQYLEASHLVQDIIQLFPKLMHLKLDGTCQFDAVDFQRLVRRLRSLQTVSLTPRRSDFLFASDTAIMYDPGDLSHLDLGSELEHAVSKFNHFKRENPDYLILAREACEDVDGSSSDTSGHSSTTDDEENSPCGTTDEDETLLFPVD